MRGLAGMWSFVKRYLRVWYHRHVKQCPECEKAVDLLLDHWFADPTKALELLDEMTK